MSRQNWSRRPFNPSNKPGTCLWCGRALRAETYVSIGQTLVKDTSRLGVGGDGYFCTLVDGYSWAVEFAKLGNRMILKEPAK
jgi:hypothetical protein